MLHSLPPPPRPPLAGVSGGSAVSPQGWRFNICADQGRCLVEPMDGTSRWFRRMWEVRGWLLLLTCMVVYSLELLYASILVEGAAAAWRRQVILREAYSGSATVQAQRGGRSIPVLSLGSSLRLVFFHLAIGLPQCCRQAAARLLDELLFSVCFLFHLVAGPALSQGGSGAVGRAPGRALV